jgi:hypothetical protein
MADEARITRLAALLAGNGFLLTKVFDLSGRMDPPTGVILIAVIPVIGLFAAYSALRFPASGRAARSTETLAVFAFAVTIGLWLIQFARQHLI